MCQVRRKQFKSDQATSVIYRGRGLSALAWSTWLMYVFNLTITVNWCGFDFAKAGNSIFALDGRAVVLESYQKTYLD